MKLLNKIFKKKVRRPPLTGTIINMSNHSGWGNSIYFSDWNSRRITGHMTPIPSIGDELRAKMESGKTARFLISKIERAGDPRDMFFGYVQDFGYTE